MPIPTPQEIRQMYLDKGAKPARCMFGVHVEKGLFAFDGKEKLACAIGICLADSPNKNRGFYREFGEKYSVSDAEAITFARQFDGSRMAAADSTYWDAVKDLA